MTDRISQILASLKKSKFRSKFKLTEKDQQYIQYKGIDTIMQHSIDFIKTRIVPQYPKNDGKETPMREPPAFIAQHAIATCCRSCIQKWHGIKGGDILNDQEIELLVGLVMRWMLIVSMDVDFPGLYNSFTMRPASVLKAI